MRTTFGLLLIAACGRIGFDGRDGAPLADGGVDAPVDAPVDLGPFGPATEVPNLSSGSHDFGPTFSYDLLEVYVAQRVTGDAEIYRFTRPDLATSFGPGEQMTALGLPSADDGEPSLTDNGLLIYLDRIVPDDAIFVSLRPSSTDTQWSTAGAVTGLDGFHSPELSGDLRMVLTDDAGVIHEATRPDASSNWGTPVSLGFTGLVPCLRHDGLEILYEGEVTISGSQSVAIHRRLRAAVDQPFGAEERLSFGVLDVAGVGDPELSPDGRTLIFSAEEILGSTYDIYIAHRP